MGFDYEVVSFPKFETDYDQLQWLLLEDQFQRSLEVPTLPPTPPSEIDFKSNLPTNLVLDQYPQQYLAPLFSQTNDNEFITPTLDNLEADFHLWKECPSLGSTNDDAWKLLSQLPLALPTIPNPNPNPNPSPNPNCTFDSIGPFALSNHNDFGDQTLGDVVVEGLNKGIHKANNHNNNNNKNNVEEEKFDGDYEFFRRNYTYKMSKIESLGYDDIRRYFDMPISMAAKKLNVGLTVLKKRCRELNIKRWPHRKIKSLKALISNVKEMGMMEVVEILEEHRRKLQMLPEFELDQHIKKLRQACFKANYKKRRALALLAHDDSP